MYKKANSGSEAVGTHLAVGFGPVCFYKMELWVLVYEEYIEVRACHQTCPCKWRFSVSEVLGKLIISNVFKFLPSGQSETRPGASGSSPKCMRSPGTISAGDIATFKWCCLYFRGTLIFCWKIFNFFLTDCAYLDAAEGVFGHGDREGQRYWILVEKGNFYDFKVWRVWNVICRTV